MQENTFADYIHLGIALIVASALCFVLLAKQPWTVQATSCALFLCAYLFHFWREPSKEIAVQADQPGPVADLEDASDLAMPSIAMPTPSRGDGAAKQTTQQAPGKASPYQREAVLITKLLQRVYKLNCEIDQRQIIIAPSFVGYVVRQTGPLEFNKLQEIEDDIAREIKQFSRKDQGDDVGVIAVKTQPIVLQVSRKVPQTLAWSERPISNSPLEVVLAKYWQGIKEQYLTVDLTDDDMVNGGCFGQPGSGKSTLLHIGLIGLLEATPPDMLEVYGIDLKKGMFAEYAGIPQVIDTASTIEGALEILETFANWCKAGNWPNDGKTRLLIIDELQMVVTHTQYGARALALLTSVLETGREAGIRVWTATQNPDKDSYPTKLKPKTHWMACAYIMNDDYVRRMLKIYGASKLRTKGELMFVGPRGDYRVKTFWLTPADRQREIEKLKAQWGAPLARTAERTVPSPSIPIATPSNTHAVGVDQPWQLSNGPLTPSQERAVCALWNDPNFNAVRPASINRIILHVYKGSKNKEKIQWIKYALDKGGIKYEAE